MHALEKTGPGLGAARVEAAPEGKTSHLLDTLTAAFIADPAVRWLYPDLQQYLLYFPRFAKAFGGAAVPNGTAFASENFGGVALWLPPGVSSDEEALLALLNESVAERIKPDAFALFEELGRFHPHMPHWYLPLFGVDPALQGRGAGSAILAHALRLCDEAGLPAYLEATSPRNTALYIRHGFEAVGEINVGECPTIVPMLRLAGAGRMAAQPFGPGESFESAAA
jgi:GNAT superfamily N-acetyltransferase